MAEFVPNPDQMALYPPISGNEINGLGEENARKPSYVYWGNDPDDVAHGAVQRWFYTVDPGLKEFGEFRAKRQDVLNHPLVEVAKRKTNLSGSDFDHMMSGGLFDKWGATSFDPIWAYEGVEINLPNIIVLGFAHDYTEISRAPAPEGGLEVMRQYYRAAKGSKDLANWLRTHGYDAEPLMGPMSGKVTMIPAALAAGFGELGKHGSIICPEFGSSFRLSAVLTNAPLELDAPVKHGIDGFCSNCRICENACPVDAIAPAKQMVRGVEKWYVDFDRCLPFFNEHQGCAICIAVCPWSRPGVGLNLAQKLERRAERLGEVSDGQ